ncbi:hypothetical protein ABPG72_018942 [Tetrahymena utriculariae]
MDKQSTASEKHPSDGFLPETDQDFTPSDLERIEKQAESKFQVYQYRFFNIGIYILGMMQISIMQNSFAPQANELSVVYGLSSTLYNLTSLVHMIMHVPVSFPANFIVDKYGTKVGNTIACVFSLAACWIRCLVNKSFAFAIIGQLLVGCANPFLINAINKISSNWFYPSSRAAVTGFLSFFSTVTGVVGLVIPGIYFAGYKAADDTSENYQHGKDLTFNLLLISAVIVSSTSVLNLLFYKDKPATPPSFSANVDREDFKTALQILIKKRTYVLITICFSFCYGCFIDFAVVLGQLVGPYGFESQHTSTLSVVCVFSGIFGSVVFIRVLKKTSAYKKLSGLGILGTIVASILMIFILQTEIFGLLICCAVILGFFVIPIIPILLELANEVCFPIGEATVTGFIYTVSHVVSFLLGSLFSLIIDSAKNSHEKMGSVYVLIAFVAIFAVSFSTIFFMKQDLKRTRAEKDQVVDHSDSKIVNHLNVDEQENAGMYVPLNKQQNNCSVGSSKSD